jgi:hypothetical protein
MTSYNRTDVREGYCGHCHDWTSDPNLELSLDDDPKVNPDVS